MASEYTLHVFARRVQRHQHESVLLHCTLISDSNNKSNTITTRSQQPINWSMNSCYCLLYYSTFERAKSSISLERPFHSMLLYCYRLCKLNVVSGVKVIAQFAFHVLRFAENRTKKKPLSGRNSSSRSTEVFIFYLNWIYVRNSALIIIHHKFE